MKKTILLVGLIGSISTGAIAEDNSKFEAYLGAAQYFWSTDRNLKDTTSLELGAELPVSEKLSVEAWFSDFNADIKRSTTDVKGNRYSFGGLYHFTNGATRPFVTLGGTHQVFDTHVDETQVYLGAGVKQYFDNNIVLRGELLGMNSLDNNFNDVGVRLAVGYAFGRDTSKPVIVAAPAPVQKVVKKEPVQEVKKVVVVPAPKPVDSDNDGIIDSLDKCAATNVAFKVDATGCPVMLVENVSIEMDVKFKTSSAVVSKEDFTEIQKVADFMKQFDKTTVTVEGYSDNRGPAAYNKSLSQKRADAVRMTLINTFKLPAERVSAKGYGAENPIADNATAEGRAANRRVVGVVKSQIKKAETK